jgi:hypothetical protein
MRLTIALCEGPPSDCASTGAALKQSTASAAPAVNALRTNIPFITLPRMSFSLKKRLI